ncbi:hypothetical protein [Halococcus sp. PRR34]|uniref:hypothetical protein n=1 Tax=Halococcus sp. PRR34 TaxID=3020830 RepID=UPI002361F352|nr:hypothetical protein [Halococcus sp. PRR34]
MSEADGSSQDLDWLSDSILIELHGRDGEATTPELVKLTGAEDRHQILYRVNSILEPKGLVESKQSEERSGSRIPPKSISLTTQGDGLAGKILNSSDDQDQSFASEFQRLQSRVEKLESTVEEQADELDKIRAAYNQMADWIEDQGGSPS